MATLLMTRPFRQSEGFIARLDPAVLTGVRIVVAPLLDIVATGAVPELEPYDGVIFTSAQGVEFAPAGGGRAAYCVGLRTAEAARARGWEVEQVARTAAELATALAKVQARRLLHLAGRHRRGDIAADLRHSGKSVDVHVLYDQHARPLSPQAHRALASADRIIVPLFSPRSAALFAKAAPEMGQAIVVALSAAVAEGLGGLKAQDLHVASAPTAKEMIYSVEKLLRHSSLP